MDYSDSLMPSFVSFSAITGVSSTPKSYSIFLKVFVIMRLTGTCTNHPESISLSRYLENYINKVKIPFFLDIVVIWAAFSMVTFILKLAFSGFVAQRMVLEFFPAVGFLTVLSISAPVFIFIDVFLLPPVPTCYWLIVMYIRFSSVILPIMRIHTFGLIMLG